MTGRLDHEELVELLPACEALVAPSTFPEAFGMVAAEAAACGALPVCAGHSGLAEVTGALAEAIPPEAAGWLSFPVDDGAVEALAGCLCGWLGADPQLRARGAAGPGRDRPGALVLGRCRRRRDRGCAGEARHPAAALSKGPISRSFG